MPTPTPPGRPPEGPGIRMSAVVMTHPARLAAAERLVAAYPGLGLRIVCDPSPGTPGGTLRTSRLAWSDVAPGATHHLVVQDDSILHPDFPALLAPAVAAMPEHALSFFTEWGSRTSNALRLAALAGAGWAEVVDTYMPAQVLVLPAGAAVRFDAHAAASGHTEDDMALLPFLRSEGLRALVSVPNLVEHAESPSLAGNDEPHGIRRAACYPPGPVDALGAAVLGGLTCVPYFSWFSGHARYQERDDTGSDLWKAGPARELLRDRGMGDRRIASFLARARAQRAESAFLTRHLAEEQVSALATTACALGAVAAGLAPGGLCLDSPAATGSLATLAPGGLRRCLSREALAEVARRLAPLVAEWTRIGAEEADAR
ncbi:hypothetical protein AGRA3207_003280 [Actinomadura graeca]|uniref:Glycosyltransferase n=1 Tax=Actinomadura graeca TaxID=2750812 RepID=A0ABX8QZT4_9ACTN|nr:hypothetical protein [Actinomadura graeca]QXJ22298.1 hypothetical protein AGRA3207_003280 [Actinomadura graeca]